MKKSIKLFALLVLGASFLTFQSCKEEDDPANPTPSSTKCYISEEMHTTVDGTYSTEYEYDNDNNLVLAIENSDSTTFEYTNGKLMRAYDGYTEAILVYSSSNVVERINIKEDGIDVQYLVLATDANSNITKIEFHYLNNGGDTIEAINYMTYDATGNITGIQLDEYNYDTDNFETFITVSSIVNDGKRNPYAESLAFFYLNSDNPLVLGKTNITSASILIAGNSFPFTSAYTYNDNNYPLTSAVTFFLGNENITYTYNCK